MIRIMMHPYRSMETEASEQAEQASDSEEDWDEEAAYEAQENPICYSGW